MYCTPCSLENVRNWIKEVATSFRIMILMIEIGKWKQDMILIVTNHNSKIDLQNTISLRIGKTQRYKLILE